MVKQNLGDLAYEAAIVPARWEHFLDTASAVANARGGVLFAIDSPAVYNLHSKALDPAWHAFVTEGWAERNPQVARAIQSGETYFQHDAQLFTEAEKATYEWFTVFWEQWDFGASLGTLLDMPRGGRLLFSLERSKAAGSYCNQDVERFNLFHADISRAVRFASEILFKEYRNTTELLQAMGVPAAVVAHNRTLLSANDLFQELIPKVAQDGRNRLRFTARRADLLLEEALSRLQPELWTGVSASFPLFQPDQRTTSIVAHVLPVRGTAHDFIPGGAAIVVLSAPRPNLAPPSDMLRQLYDLSPSEARVAAALVNNRGSYAEVAESLSLSKETIRSHSKSIYQKLGLGSAIDLLALVSQIQIKQ